MQSTSRCSGQEKARRMAVVGTSRIGRYACLSSEVADNHHYADTARELSKYILKMSYFGVSDHLEFQNSRIEDCLKLMENLGLVKKEGKVVNILDQKVV